MSRDKLGRFQKGNKIATGRGKNKVTQLMREKISTFIEANYDDMQEQYDQLEPKEKLTFMVHLLKLVVPSRPATLEVDQLSDDQIEALYYRTLENNKSDE